MNDARLKAALLIAAAEDFSWAFSLEEEVVFSHRFLRRMERIIHNPKKYSRPLYVKFLQTAAGIILTLAMIGSIIYQIPSTRALLQRFIVRHFEIYDLFEIIPNTDNTELSTWMPEYIPEEYFLSETLDMDGLISLTYSSSGCEDIYFEYMLMEGGTTIIDNEHQIIENISINDNLATVYRAISEDWCSYVFWVDESCNTMFTVYGYVDCDELIKIAKSIKNIKFLFFMSGNHLLKRLYSR